MFMYLGELVEYDLTDKMFTNPANKTGILPLGTLRLSLQGLADPYGSIG